MTVSAEINRILEGDDGVIRIVSGEGYMGDCAAYTGKRTGRAIMMRLTRERCGGARWARAEIYVHDSATGPVYRDMVTGEMV